MHITTRFLWIVLVAAAAAVQPAAAQQLTPAQRTTIDATLDRLFALDLARTLAGKRSAVHDREAPTACAEVRMDLRPRFRASLRHHVQGARGEVEAPIDHVVTCAFDIGAAPGQLEYGSAIARDQHASPADHFRDCASALRRADAFTVEAVDYVPKPVDPERLQLAVERARARLETVRMPVSPLRLAALSRALMSTARLERVVVRHEGRVMVLRTTEIVRVEAHGNSVHVITAGRTHRMRGSLTQMARRLPPSLFARANRAE